MADFTLQVDRYRCMKLDLRSKNQEELCMDGNERESTADVSAGSGTAARMKKNLIDKAQDAKDGLTELGLRTAGRIDGSRESTANALAWTATSLHSGTDKMSRSLHSRTDKMSHLAHSAADKIQVGANYLQERDVDQIVEDVRGLVKKYPGRSLAAAAIFGFLVARRLQRSND
jgi:hypothetical protein